MFACFILRDRFGELIGAGGVVSATDSNEGILYFVDVLALNELCNALQVTAATADKTDVVHFVVCVNVEKNLSGTSASGRISEHE